MRSVLFVSYAFPPVGGAGVQRPSKFAKFLPRMGWKPWVLTAENPSVPIFDEGLLADIPPEAEIIRARTLEPSYQAKQKISSGQGGGLLSRLKAWLVGVAKGLLLPDLQILWWPRALPKLVSTIRRNKIDVVFASGPPFSSLLLAILAKFLTRVPVVVDFRDEWGFSRTNSENMARHRLASWMDLAMERWVISHCTDFTAATQTYVEAIRDRHPTAAFGKGHCITNGYDPDDFPNTPVRQREPGRLRMFYAGTVWAATSLRHFLQALAETRMEGNAPGLELAIAGRVVEEEGRYLEDERLGDSVEMLGYRSHREVVGLMGAADVLLLTLSDMPAAGRIIPGKVFEYIASNRHILALLPEGEASQLLRENHISATILDPTDVRGIKEAMTALLDSPAGLESAPTALDRFSRLTLTRQLRGVLTLASDARDRKTSSSHVEE